MKKKIVPLANEIDVKKYLLEVLDYIDSVCKENNIKYFILFGTLLGAVRHKGFIPWDDDIDIVMFRLDYDRFIDLIEKKQHPSFGIITHKNNQKYYLPFAKVYSKKTILFEHVPRPVKMGVYVDVFPLDYCGNSFDEAASFVGECYKNQRLLNIKNLKFSAKRNFAKNIFLFFLKASLVFTRRRKIVKKMYEKAISMDNVYKKYVSSLCMIVYKEKAIFDSDLFDETIRLEFEGRTYMAPKNYEAILKNLYGDYMKLPPIEKQVSHHGYDLFIIEEDFVHD